MGLFDFFSKSKTDAAPKRVNDREIARLGKVAADKLAQNYDRQEAIDELAKIASAASAAALLRRFEWTMDPSITDHEEKEAALRGIVAAGHDALVPIRDFCARAEGLTWPLKALRQIVTPDVLPEELLGILDGFDTEYRRNAEPKVQIIQALAEHKLEDVRDAVEPFLEDASEPVRFAAVTTLFALDDRASVPLLVVALADDESLRVKNRIAQGLSDRGWELSAEDVERLRGGVPDQFRLDGSRIQRIG